MNVNEPAAVTNPPRRGGPITVGMIGLGNMGGWVARQLRGRGVDVCAVLSGRSANSARCAETSGVRTVRSHADLVRVADVFLSIVPPSASYSTAQDVAVALRGGSRRIQYIDLNAVSAATVARTARLFDDTGADFIDGSIIGAVPADDVAPRPRFYISGPAAAAVQLANYGLDVRIADGPIGSASSLKCCFAGLSKGLTALSIKAILAAASAGVTAPLVHELAHHSPLLGELLQRLLPDTFSKADRWVCEMRQIAEELQGTPGGAASFHGAASTFAAVAADSSAGAQHRIARQVEHFLTMMRQAQSKAQP